MQAMPKTIACTLSRVYVAGYAGVQAMQAMVMIDRGVLWKMTEGPYPGVCLF